MLEQYLLSFPLIAPSVFVLLYIFGSKLFKIKRNFFWVNGGYLLTMMIIGVINKIYFHTHGAIGTLVLVDSMCWIIYANTESRILLMILVISPFALHIPM